MTSGRPSGTKTKEAESGCASGSGSASPTPEDESKPCLSTKGLKLMNGAGGKHSRAEMKTLAHEVNAENKKLEADAVLKRRALEALSTPPEDSKSSLELVESVKALTRAVVSKELLDQEQAERARWNERVRAMESKLALWGKMGKGSTAEAQALQEELLHAYDNPVVAPLSVAAPSVAEGDGEGVAEGEVVGTEGGET